MFTYNVSISDIDIFTEYIYVHRNENNMYNLNVCLRNNKEVRKTLGYGEYSFVYKENVIYLSYKEESVPKNNGNGLSYFTRLLIECAEEDVLNDLCEEVMKYHVNKGKSKKKDELFVYTCTKEGYWELYSKIPSRNFNSIYMENSIIKRITDDIENFIVSEDEYNKFGIPYKRVYLLTGIPGSGKTSLIKAICSKFGFHLSMLTICKGFTNSALMEAMRDAVEKTVFLIEDIDGLFNKRESTSDNTSLTFSNLINIFDGVLYNSSKLIFLTTNHPEKLDPALLRLGRVDMIVQINYPVKSSIHRLFYDMMKDRMETGVIEHEFTKFYDMVKNKKITMSSYVNFLFRYREDWEKNVDDFLLTDIFIRDTMGERKDSIYT